MSIKGIIFDLDGVVTQTASIHFRSWKIIIDEFLCFIGKQIMFSESDYFLYLDGIPRNEGLINFLNAQNISDSTLAAFNTTRADIIDKIARSKNQLFGKLLSKETEIYFPDTLEFIEFLWGCGYKIALISSSKNCIPILKQARIDHLFPIYVDGNMAEKLNLPGKPEPNIFLEAAKRLNLLPEECLVIEDALAGVMAAKKANFGAVIALDRNNKLYTEFLKLKPDFILSDLSENQVFLYQRLEANAAPKSGRSLISLINSLKDDYQFAIFLDYDGTLTPIRNHPKEALLSSSMHACLATLSQLHHTVIMSGRELENLQQLIDIPNIFYSGNHGLEFEGPNVSWKIGDEFTQELNELYLLLHNNLGHIPGCIIENKKFSLSVHYRLVEQKYLAVIATQIAVCILNYPNLRQHDGKKVYEIRPDILWNKGIASLAILNRFKLLNPDLVPIYIGDDVSDEDAFEAFQWSGITIKVSEHLHNTKAQFHLPSSLEVQQFLTDVLNMRG